MTNDDRLEALKARRDAYIAAGVQAEYLHLEFLLELETALTPLDHPIVVPVGRCDWCRREAICRVGPFDACEDHADERHPPPPDGRI